MALKQWLLSVVLSSSTFLVPVANAGPIENGPVR